MKERLTGAIILVALIVLLVPELLTGPIRRKSAPVASSTAASLAGAPAGRAAHPEPPLRSYTLTLGGQPTAHDAVATPAAQTPAPTAASSQASSPAISPKSSSGTSAPARTATLHQDVPHTSQQRAGAGSDGLQRARSPADTALRKSRSSGSSGSAPRSGWVVQLGSFASRQNADHLARTLRGKGFRMTVSPARAGSRVLWRVRAGPSRDRAAALRLAAHLRALGHRGELIPLR